MRVKLLIGLVSAVITAMTVGVAFGSAPGGQNANKSSAHKMSAKPAKPAASKDGGQTAAAPAGASSTAPKMATHAHRRPKPRGEAGVPSGGPGACVERLGMLAEKDPLPPYEGAPSRIVNDGLLWNDPHSKCAVTDEAARAKIFNLATAWQEKDAGQVRSILGDLKSTMPPPEHKAMPHHRKHVTAKPAAGTGTAPAKK